MQYIKIEGYDYEIREDGRVRSLKSKRLLALRYNTTGYPHQALCKNRVAKDRLNHRLTAKYFVPNPNNHKYVNHLDRNKKNPHKDNLEWCSQSENIKYHYTGKKDLPF